VPTIHIEMFEGRTALQKAALAKEFTEACVRVLGSKRGPPGLGNRWPLVERRAGPVAIARSGLTTAAAR
jgi:hypothetical protein